MTIDSIRKVTTVINTLDKVEVSGRSNMQRLLGCISILEEILTKETESPTEGKSEVK